MDFTTWTDRLDMIGPFCNLDTLRAHLDAAPIPGDAAEAETLNFARRIYQTRSTGGDVLALVH